jgi:G3E family GTPase
MVDLFNIYPAGLRGDRVVCVSGIVRSIFMKSCFNVNIKRALGISGFYSNYSTPECWTVKTLYNKGVYGLSIKAVREVFGVVECTMKLKYFPHPDEEYLDNFSIAEIMIAAENNYSEMIRDFAAVPVLYNLFDIGEIVLKIHKDLTEAEISLFTSTFSKTILEDGLYLETPEGTAELVKPMGADRNIPSYRLALPFFRSFCGGFTYSLQSPASDYSKSVSGGSVFTVAGSGKKDKKADESCKSIEFSFVYGQNRQVISKTFTTVTEDKWWECTSPEKKSVMDNRPRLLIVTGFLGGGKTSFIKKLIEHETDKNRFVGVIQNEAGETGLDGYLLDYDYSIVQIDEGCVCCSLSGQLKAAVNELSKERVPDTVILETSGIANPMNLASELDDLKEVVRFDSVTTVVDASSVLTMMPESELMKDQVRAADIIVLNKTDITPEDSLDMVCSEISYINSDAFLVRSIHGDTNFSMLYGNEKGADNISKIELAAGTTHSHEHIMAEKFSDGYFEKIDDLMEYLSENTKGAFRVKGIVDIGEVDHPVIVQGVNGRVELVKPDRTPPEERFLIVIKKVMEKVHHS